MDAEDYPFLETVTTFTKHFAGSDPSAMAAVIRRCEVDEGLLASFAWVDDSTEKAPRPPHVEPRRLRLAALGLKAGRRGPCPPISWGCPVEGCLDEREDFGLLLSGYCLCEGEAAERVGWPVKDLGQPSRAELVFEEGRDVADRRDAQRLGGGHLAVLPLSRVFDGYAEQARKSGAAARSERALNEGERI